MDEYRFVRLIGRGGMGRIYLAQDTLLERPVAVKFIASVRPDEDARQRFFVEARALARLSHPNVVSVHRVGEVEEHPYLITEFIRGRALSELAKPIPWERALRIGIGLARGLAAAHREGILHRDIKPANAMLTDDERVKLLDFGLAKLLLGQAPPPPPEAPAERASSSRELTRPDGLLGTPLYMAPETLRGEPATARSDLYSLGSLLYELCTGVAPRDTVPPDLPIERWIATTPAPLAHGVDPRFASVISRCLEQEPARRFASAEELCGTLEELEPERLRGELPAGNPYRGLRPFESEHRALFFGRSAETSAVVERLSTGSLVVVTGDSGVGKSSLCRAGVLPLVAEGALKDGLRYRIVSLVPGRHPLTALGTALANVFHLHEVPPAEMLASAPRELARQLKRVQEPGTGLLLFVDQLEELFTLAGPTEAEFFAKLLVHLTAVPGLRVLLTVRGDFFTRLGALGELGEEVSRALFLLRPLSPEAMRSAITSPARQKGFRFESDAMVETLVASASGTAGGLPLLQFAMAELWEARAEAARLIPASALDAMGGVAGALARHADGVLAGLLPEQRRAARRLLLRLATVEGTRIRRIGSELDAEQPDNRAALDALVRGRLLVASELEGETVYELAHESLLQNWDTLRGWLDADGEQRHIRGRLETAAAEWMRLERSAEVLWSGRQLAEASRLDPSGLARRELEFLNVSRSALRWRRFRQWAILVSIPLVLGVGVIAAQVDERLRREEQAAKRAAVGQGALKEGSQLQANAEELRKSAYRLFDEIRDKPAAQPFVLRAKDAEDEWAAALKAFKDADAAFSRASLAYEGAFAAAPSSAARARVADALVERIKLAELFHQQERREELIERLPAYDDDGSRVRALDLPPHLSVSTSPEGAKVLLEKYVQDEQGRRERTDLEELGSTPLVKVDLPRGPGSYRLTFEFKDYAPVRYPILLSPGETLDVSVKLLKQGSVPPGFVYVPKGRFLLGSVGLPEKLRGHFLKAPPMHEIETEGFLISQTEVTFQDWISYLESLPAAQRWLHLPKGDLREWGTALTRQRNGRWRITLALNGRRLSAEQGKPLYIEARSRRQSLRWERLPVSGVSLNDAQDYVDWLKDPARPLGQRIPGARLCREREWERAARGADDRAYPHGDLLSPDDANFDETYDQLPHAFGPDEVGSHPVSQSPFEVSDMVGNIFELTTSMWEPGKPVLRGGSWYYDAISDIAWNRTVTEPKARDPWSGFRVCADMPLPP